MKRLLSIAALSLLASACHFTTAEARDAGPMVDRTYQVGAFDRITVAGPYEVTVTTGGQPGVTAHGGEAILAETDVVVDNGELQIKPKRKHGFSWNWGSHDKITVNVSAAALRAATIAGSGWVHVDKVSGPEFKGEVAGSGDLGIAALDVAAAKFGIAGSGDIRAVGKTRQLDVDIAGSGDIDLTGLQSETAKVSIAGSGNVRAHASATADVSVMGSGDVELSGGARCTVSKHGSGDVRCS